MATTFMCIIDLLFFKQIFVWQKKKKEDFASPWPDELIKQPPKQTSKNIQITIATAYNAQQLHKAA